MRIYSKRRILAIDPGTREMGVALLEGDRLIHHGVKVFTNRSSPHVLLRECRRYALWLIRDYQPDLLVIEKTFFARSRNTALLNVFADEIKAVAKRKRVPVVGFAPSTVKKRIAGNGHATKEEVARVIVAHFPELRVYIGQDRKWKSRFHENMFDAVALGLLASKN